MNIHEIIKTCGKYRKIYDNITIGHSADFQTCKYLLEKDLRSIFEQLSFCFCLLYPRNSL